MSFYSRYNRSFIAVLNTFNAILNFAAILAITGVAIPGDVYAWTAVFILPLNSALNPFLYTLSAIIGKKVPVTCTCDNRF